MQAQTGSEGAPKRSNTGLDAHDFFIRHALQGTLDGALLEGKDFVRYIVAYFSGSEKDQRTAKREAAGHIFRNDRSRDAFIVAIQLAPKTTLSQEKTALFHAALTTINSFSQNALRAADQGGPEAKKWANEYRDILRNESSGILDMERVISKLREAPAIITASPSRPKEDGGVRTNDGVGLLRRFWNWIKFTFLSKRPPSAQPGDRSAIATPFTGFLTDNPIKQIIDGIAPAALPAIKETYKASRGATKDQAWGMVRAVATTFRSVGTFLDRTETKAQGIVSENLAARRARHEVESAAAVQSMKAHAEEQLGHGFGSAKYQIKEAVVQSTQGEVVKAAKAAQKNATKRELAELKKDAKISNEQRRRENVRFEYDKLITRAIKAGWVTQPTMTSSAVPAATIPHDPETVIQPGQGDEGLGVGPRMDNSSDMPGPGPR